MTFKYASVKTSAFDPIKRLRDAGAKIMAPKNGKKSLLALTTPAERKKHLGKNHW